jgi:hypothetical protein
VAQRGRVFALGRPVRADHGGQKGRKEPRTRSLRHRAEAADRCGDYATDGHVHERQAQAKKPFFAYATITQPHLPTLPNPAFAGKTGNGDWADMLAEMDHNVGQMLDAVERLGIRDDTIVIFASDNGPEFIRPWDGWAGPWRGQTKTRASIPRACSLSAAVGPPIPAPITAHFPLLYVLLGPCGWTIGERHRSPAAPAVPGGLLDFSTSQADIENSRGDR